MEPFDCVIVGAGQSGLFMAKSLAENGYTYLVVERGSVAESWRRRPQDMRLFTSRQFCELPGLGFSGERSGFPTCEEMVHYLTHYAALFNLNLSLHTSVNELVQLDEMFRITLDSGQTIFARTVVNATGSNQEQIVPSMSKALSEHVLQLPSSTQHFDDIKAGWKVAVIGDGASGRQISSILADRCQVTLACGSRRSLPPNTVLGKDIFWWLKKTGVLSADTNGVVASMLKKRNPVPVGAFNNRQLRKRGVTIKPRLLSCSDSKLIFADKSTTSVNAVVWATGYRDQTDWVNIDGCVDNRGIIQRYGKTPAQGFFVVGRKWLSCRASELVMGVEKDVGLVLGHLTEYLHIKEQCNG